MALALETWIVSHHRMGNASSWIRELILKHKIIFLWPERFHHWSIHQGLVPRMRLRNDLEEQSAPWNCQSMGSNENRYIVFHLRKNKFSDEELKVISYISEKGFKNHCRLSPEDRLDVILKSQLQHRKGNLGVTFWVHARYFKIKKNVFKVLSTF